MSILSLTVTNLCYVQAVERAPCWRYLPVEPIQAKILGCQA